MGFVANAFKAISSPRSFAPLAVSPFMSGQPVAIDGKFSTLAREGYSANEIVFACIEELATSAAEPRMHARVGGQWTLEHQVLDLMRRPNPFMDHFEFWSSVIMYRSLAGNAYALKVRSRAGRVVEMWLMRPDRVRPVPSREKYISHYELAGEDGEVWELPARDVIHWKTRNPLNEFLGMPPLLAAAGRVDIDNFMRDFVKAFFRNAGVPGGMLTIENSLTPELRNEVKQRFRKEYGGPAGWHSILVLDNTKASFTPMTSQLGDQGLVVPELEKMSVRRIAMTFQVPPALIGADDAPTSYAALEMVQRFFWDNTLAPLYKELAGPLNMGFSDEFTDVEEVAFDLSDVRALQEDIDKRNARYRADFTNGVISREETRTLMEYGPVPAQGVFMVPGNMAEVPVDRLGEPPEPPEQPVPALAEAE